MIGVELFSSRIETTLGPMVAIGDNNALYLLDFIDRKNLEPKIECLRIKLNANVKPGQTSLLKQIKNEITNYFNGKKIDFSTIVHMVGSDFQKQVWQELQTIPIGETQSYLDIAKKIKKPKAYRAVANANAANPLSIIVPCHRVINANGELGGYGGGVHRKKWLLEHENTI